MSGRAICCFLLALHLTEALVQLAHSQTFDEYDFKGQSSVTVTQCSVKCRLYASVTPGSEAQLLADNLIIQMSNDEGGRDWVNVAEVAGIRDPTTGQKGYVTIKNTAKLKIANWNRQRDAGPVVVYVVSVDDESFYDDIEIYDAFDLNRAPAPAQAITIMDSEPFVLETVTVGPMTVSAFAAGFEAFDSSDACTSVLRQEGSTTYQDVRLLVRSPFLTLVYDNFTYQDTTIALSASKDDGSSFDLAKPMFVTSPGYIGCSVKEGQPPSGGVKSFRSSLYSDETVVNFKSDVPVSMMLSGEVAVDDAHPVTVTADRITIWTVVNTSEDKYIAVEANELTVKWARNPADSNEYFMIRVEQEHSLKTSTEMPTVSARPTTKQPDKPITTTTVEPGPEPTHTTTLKPTSLMSTLSSTHSSTASTATTKIVIPTTLSTTTTEPEPTGNPNTTPQSTITFIMTTTTFRHNTTVSSTDASESSTATTSAVIPTTSGVGLGSLLHSMALAAVIILI